MRRMLVTGCGGLIGSQAVRHFYAQGWEVLGMDDDSRRAFFGDNASVADTLTELLELESGPGPGKFSMHYCDVKAGIPYDWKGDIDAVVHCAAQPSHDYANTHELEDFDVNARGTLKLLVDLERHTRNQANRPVFVFMSTNKVYGDRPNKIPMFADSTRLCYDAGYIAGVDETMSLDDCGHSLFGTSKAAADLIVQEFNKQGRCRTACFRAGCLTGSGHKGAELHGFLSYLTKCVVHEKPYTIFGYGGLQVRDNLHAYDMVRAVEEVIETPDVSGVFNIGGGMPNSCSVIEAIKAIERISGKQLEYTVDPVARFGDHRCYVTNLTKFREACPRWEVTRNLESIYRELVEHEFQFITDEP